MALDLYCLQQSDPIFCSEFCVAMQPLVRSYKFQTVAKKLSMAMIQVKVCIKIEQKNKQKVSVQSVIQSKNSSRASRQEVLKAATMTNDDV